MLSKWYIRQIVEWKILIISKFDAEGKINAKCEAKAEHKAERKNLIIF
jgi:hypothetical protein